MIRSRTKNFPALTLSLVVSLSAATGCGGNSGLSTKWEGIYEIFEWTENLEGCTIEGPSVLASKKETMVVVSVKNFIADFLTVIPCADLDSCRETAQEDFGPFFFFGWTLTSGSDADGWHGETTMATGGLAPENCEGQVTNLTLTSPTEEVIELEVHGTDAGEFPVDASGECTTEAAAKAAKGKPCSTFENLAARLKERLP